MIWKDFFYFTRKERQGILALVVILALIVVGKHLFARPAEPLLPIEEESGISGVSIIAQQPVSNPARELPPPEKRTYYQQEQKETTDYRRTEKYPAGTLVDLNAVDTLELQRIPGIGESYARRILKYRQLLGGYYSVVQLQEVYGMYVELYETVAPYFRVPTDSLRKIDVNKARLGQMKAHPYLNFYQAKAIADLRKKKPIQGLQDLSLMEEFTEKDLDRLKYYLSFD